MSTMSMKPHTLGAIAMGVVYGLILRLGFNHHLTDEFLQIISTTFLVVAPFCVGAVAVLGAAGNGESITIGRQAGVSAGAMLLFLVAMFALYLEGLICIVLVLPVFIIAAILGGLVAGFIHNHVRLPRSSLPVFALLPFLLGPLEAALPPHSTESLVSTTVHIDASAGQVFDQLANVNAIREDELGFAWVHLIGLPKPVSAAMDGAGVGSVRTSTWQKGVRFKEVITAWDRPYAMHYRFEIRPGSIPREALDEHVEMGGEYFTVLDGGYDIAADPAGGVVLKLSTRFQNKSRLKLYGDLWGRFVLADFHRSILGLMKTRAERSAAAGGKPA